MKHNYNHIYVGEYNSFAVKVLEQALSSPSKYPSIYLIGDWGYGKTTLLRAFKGSAIARGRSAVFYSASKFMEELFKSMKCCHTLEFRESLCGVDVLILDDIEILKNKSGTQNILLEILDSREERGKLTVFSSFLIPHNNIYLNNALTNRLRQFMTIHLMKPDQNEWPSIVRWLVKDLHLSCSEDIIESLCSRTYRDIGDIKFWIMRLKIAEDIFNVKLTLEDVQTILVSKNGSDPYYDLSVFIKRRSRE